MGSCMYLASLSDANIARVLADPESIWNVLSPNSSVRRDAVRAQWSLGPDERRMVDLGKDWHGVHYLLCGASWPGNPPLDFLLISGREVGAVDVGYGPARVLQSGEVRAVHAALATLDEPTLRRRYDSDAMNALHIYPSSWGAHPNQVDWLVSHIADLRAFLDEVVAAQLGVVIWRS